ncbi:hypothetical protein F5148DRAFT_1340758 [Russula earlei]|uniref:Uncharacterized protein n=1 Tax=Russula earlei TaxID=71964 RepID=A0ACC0TW57_9AGAM|nr:hypothetical protein F5148DRAFT_1340758 [Russula earlei]
MYPTFPHYNPAQKPLLLKGTAGPLGGELHSTNYFHGQVHICSSIKVTHALRHIISDGLSSITESHPELNLPPGFLSKSTQNHPHLEIRVIPVPEATLDLLTHLPPAQVLLLPLHVTSTHLLPFHGYAMRIDPAFTADKLSPKPLNVTPIPNKGQLFVVVGSLGWFVAIISSDTGLGTYRSMLMFTLQSTLPQALAASPLMDLCSHLSSLDVKSDNAFKPQRKIPFSSVSPNYLLFSLNDTRLVVGLIQGPVIVFDASAICSPGDNQVTPLHTFLPTMPAWTTIHQMYANPGDIPELVALLWEPDGSPDSQLVQVINVSTMQSIAGWSSGGSPETFPTSSKDDPLLLTMSSLSNLIIVSWSPRGKQLAIALQSGDIVTFSPNETHQAKSFVSHPPSMQGQSLIHTMWLSNPAFYAIFAPPGPLDPQVDQKHMVIVHDTKCPDTSTDIVLPINFFPSGIRLPGAFTITLRGWDPAKVLLLVGDSTTSDIGLVCCTVDDKWQKLSFDEGAPSMPLDVDQNCCAA